MILSTGAAIGGGMNDVLRKTRDRLAILGIPPAHADVAERVQAVFSTGGVGVWRRNGERLFKAPVATLNAAQALLDLSASVSNRVADDIATLAVSGAVGKLLWRAVMTLLDRHPGLTLVVADGTKLFIDALDLAAFERQGGRLCAMRGIRLIGVTLNPFSPFGGSFDAQAFLNEARIALSEHIVTDVRLHQEGS